MAKRVRERWVPNNYYAFNTEEQMRKMEKNANIRGKIIFLWHKFRFKYIDKHTVVFFNTEFYIFLEDCYAAIKYFLYQGFGFEIYAIHKAQFMDYVERNYVVRNFGRTITGYYLLVLFTFVYAVNMFACLDSHLHQTVQDTTRLVF